MTDSPEDQRHFAQVVTDPGQRQDVATTPETRQQPQSARDLFWSFSVLALQGFGGVFAVAQRELVERKRWLSQDEFIGDWAVAQILPGPNMVNLSLMIGERYFGLRGAMAALAGMLTFPLLILISLTLLFASVADHPAAQGAMRGLGAVAAGLIAGAALKLVPALRSNVLGQAVCSTLGSATFLAIAHFHLPLVWVLLGLGALGGILSWKRLGQLPAAAPEAEQA